MTFPLDPAKDPDRYDPARDAQAGAPDPAPDGDHKTAARPEPAGRLDPAKDPDRYDPARDAQAGALDPAPGGDPKTGARPEPAGRLDPAKDPDRYDPARDAQAGPLDPAQDSDRLPAGYGGTGQGQTLTGLLGDGAQEQKREGLAWLFGLLAVIGFLVLVSLLVRLGH